MINKLFGNSASRRFKSLSKEFEAVLKRLKDLGHEPYLMPFWDGVNKKVESSITPYPPEDFLNIRAIRDTMFVVGDQNWLDTQIRFLKKKLGDKFHGYTNEEKIGSPLLLDAPLDFTSHNTIHHLYHIYFYLQETGHTKHDINTVVEWGGGYGNFAKLWRRAVDPGGTYIIIDTALFTSVQWLYLSTVLGEEQVHLLDNKRSKIVPGKINLVPLALMDGLKIKGDLFVSTWGLSESLDKAQDYVVKKGWFGCDKLLIGFQKSNDDLVYASRLGDLAKKSGASIIDIEFIPNNYYAFK